jgi:hypothetical protein
MLTCRTDDRSQDVAGGRSVRSSYFPIILEHPVNQLLTFQLRSVPAVLVMRGPTLNLTNLETNQLHHFLGAQLGGGSVAPTRAPSVPKPEEGDGEEQGEAPVPEPAEDNNSLNK